MDSNTTQTIIHLTNLLSRAQMLLLQSVKEKEYLLANTFTAEKYCVAKPAGDEKTRLWLEAKAKSELDEIMSLMCVVDAAIAPPACSSEKQSEFSEKQRKAISLLLENEKVLDNVYRLANKLEQQEHA